MRRSGEPRGDVEDRSYGFPVGLWRALERNPPPGLGRSRAWRSPLRGPWLTLCFRGGSARGPSWVFQLTEGLHVVLGLVIIPVVLAKLWSVVPKLFAWPPARSVAQVLERLPLAVARRRHAVRDRRTVGGMRRVLAMGALLYLGAAVVTRIAEEAGAQRCHCSSGCWCRRPILGAFRWVAPLGHR